eukprot:c14555_g1_i1.p1 GENE.c14555_g1_i1~~c14555_g1_i1.p1  ORF type:complete len:290 (+),score=57.11 c14555_g1_i1:78-872(+)
MADGTIECPVWYQRFCYIIAWTNVFSFPLAFTNFIVFHRVQGPHRFNPLDWIVLFAFPLLHLIYNLNYRFNRRLRFSRVVVPSAIPEDEEIDPNPIVSSMWVVLVGPFRGKYFFWEGSVISFQVVCVAILALVPDPCYRWFTLAVWFCVALVIHIKVEPYRSTGCNRLQTSLLLFLFVTTIENLGVAVLMDAGAKIRRSVFESFLLLFGTLLLASGLAYLMIRDSKRFLVVSAVELNDFSAHQTSDDVPTTNSPPIRDTSNRIF